MKTPTQIWYDLNSKEDRDKGREVLKGNLPRLEVPKTRIEKILNMIGYGVYILVIIFLLIKLFQLPDEIPAHFNMSGEVTRWGSKYELLILPIIGTFTILITEFFEKHPEFHNYPSRINEDNAEQFYLNSRRMLNQMKNIMSLMFAFIIIEMILVSEGEDKGFGMWPMFLLLIALFIPLIIGIVRQTKIK